MSMDSFNYHPGVYVRSRSTQRTSSIVLSKNEISFTHGFENEKIDLKNGNSDNNKKHRHHQNKHHEKHTIEDIEHGSLDNMNMNDLQKHNMKNRANMLLEQKEDDNDEEEEEEEDEEEDVDDDLESIASVDSMASGASAFFHPKYFNYNYKQTRHRKYTPSATTKSVMSIASHRADIDELELLPNMEELHHYDKHKPLGTGTDAHVYEVVDRRDKSHVAMKLTKRKSGRYRTEIHLLHQLRTCPYIVKLLKVLEDSSVYVLIMEQAPMTLEMLLHERCTNMPMQERVGREIMNDVLKGIRAIHNLGFVHKDIKPENVLIFADRTQRKLQAKIADFGFATRAQPPKDIINNINNKFIPKQTLSEFVERVADKCGTPGFWAPELVAGCVELSDAFKMDVFSAGVTLYRMLCNEMPFGLFETWDIKQEGITKKLAKMKPNFQVVSWIQTKQKSSNTSKTSSSSTQNDNNNNNIDYIRKLAATNLTKPVLTLLRGMLRIRPHKRLTVSECLRSQWYAANM